MFKFGGLDIKLCGDFTLVKKDVNASLHIEYDFPHLDFFGLFVLEFYRCIINVTSCINLIAKAKSKCVWETASLLPNQQMVMKNDSTGLLKNNNLMIHLKNISILMFCIQHTHVFAFFHPFMYLVLYLNYDNIISYIIHTSRRWYSIGSV